MIIYFHPRFQRSYSHIDKKLKAQSEIKVEIFKSDPFNKSLDTHYLHGKLKNQLSFSVNSRYRILFEFLGKKKREVVFLDIGDHNIYR